MEGVEVLDLRNVQTPPIGGRNPGSRRMLSFDSHLEVLLRDRKLYFSSLGSEPTGVHTIGRCIGLDAKVEVTAEWDGKVYTNLRDARIVAAALYQAA